MQNTPHTPRLLMCPPDYYGIRYVINPWMEGHINRVNLDKAKAQWQTLHDTLAALTKVELLRPAPELPDLVFTANAGLVLGQTVVPVSFRVPERQPEQPTYLEAFQKLRLNLEELGPDQPFEGEGDALFQPGQSLLWAGYGVRTGIEAHPSLTAAFNVEVVSLRLVDPRFYHLDTCFLPLPGNRAVYFAPAFDEFSLAAIKKRIPLENRIEVSEEDALKFACNAVRVGNTLVTGFVSAALRAKLEAWGFAVKICDVSEYLLAGGGCKCLTLQLDQAPGCDAPNRGPFTSEVSTTRLQMRGHLLDSGLLNRVISAATEAGLGFRVEKLTAGERHDQPSVATIRVTGRSTKHLNEAVASLMSLGAHPISSQPADAETEPAPKDGVAPEDFYSTTIYPTFVRIDGKWVKAQNQRMDGMLVISGAGENTQVHCALIRNLKQGERVVVGVNGVRVDTPEVNAHGEGFSFMSAGVSSERRVEHSVDELAWEIERVKARGGKVAIVSGPVVIHTGGGPYLQKLIEHGFVQVLLTGNALPTHDIESNMFGTSLGVDLARGRGVRGGHTHHLRAINRVRMAGSIKAAVEQGVITGGLMHACVKHNVNYVLAGSIRDDGPLPDTLMDLEKAQAAYSEALKGCEVVLMLSTMLHSIGVGNMTPAGVKLVCVDINPAVVTKLADRGSVESVGIVTDVGLFLNLLARRLCGGEK